MFLYIQYFTVYSLFWVFKKIFITATKEKNRYDNKKMAKLQQFAKALQLSVVFDQHGCWKGFIINFTHKN